jgi:hypothetical protein
MELKLTNVKFTQRITNIITGIIGLLYGIRRDIDDFYNIVIIILSMYGQMCLELTCVSVNHFILISPVSIKLCQRFVECTSL